MVYRLTPFFERFLGNGTFIFGYERYIVIYIEYEYISIYIVNSRMQKPYS